MELDPNEWYVGTHATDTARGRSLRDLFNALATRAALAANLEPIGRCPLNRWLDRLKQTPHYEPIITAAETAEGDLRSVEGG
jgi:hypothetical protein